MLEPLLLFTLAALFFTGYATPGYVGVLVPASISIGRRWRRAG